MSSDVPQHSQVQLQAQAQQGRRNLTQTSPPSTSTPMSSGGGVLYSTMDGVNNRPRSSLNGYSGSSGLNGSCATPNGLNNANGGLNGSPRGGHTNTNGMMNGSAPGISNGLVNGLHGGSGGMMSSNTSGLNVTPTISSPGDMGRMGASLTSPNQHHNHHHHSQQHSYQQNPPQFGQIHAGQGHPGAPGHSGLQTHVWQPAPEVDYSPALSDDGDDFEDNIELHVGVAGGNWGKKSMKGARWVRRGKAVAWGPARGEWEAEERARKRLKTLLGPARSPSPPILSHLRDPSPPRGTNYSYSYSNSSAVGSVHGSFAAFVLDPSVAHSYCTHLLDDLQQTTENLVQGEATLTRALGRLWKVLSEEDHTRQEIEKSNHSRTLKGKDSTTIRPDRNGDMHEDVNGVVDVDEVTLEDDEESQEVTEREKRIARAPSLVSTVHKLFLTPLPEDASTIIEPSHIGSPEMQQDSMEKAFATLRELGDDSREYVERLAEIRECLGDVRRQRDVIWMKTREQALEELKEIDQAAVDADELGPEYVYDEY